MFTVLETKIYDTITQGIIKDHKMTIKEIAELVDCSHASVIKLSKKLGYTGFTDMYYNLVEEEKENYLSISAKDLIKKTEVSKIIKKIELVIDINNVEDIILISIGFCDTVKKYLRDELLLKGYPVNIMSEPKLVAKNKVAVIMSESGISPLEVAQKCKKAGYRILSFTSNSLSPLAQISDEIINIKNTKSNIFSYEPNFFTANLFTIIHYYLEII